MSGLGRGMVKPACGNTDKALYAYFTPDHRLAAMDQPQRTWAGV